MLARFQAELCTITEAEGTISNLFCAVQLQAKFRQRGEDAISEEIVL